MEKKYRLKQNINMYLLEGDTVHVNTKSVSSSRDIPSRYLKDAFYLFADPLRRIHFFEREEKLDINYAKIEDSFTKYYMEDNERNTEVVVAPPSTKNPCLKLQIWVNGETFTVQQIGYYDTSRGDLVREEMKHMITNDFQQILQAIDEKFLSKLK